MSTAFDLWPRSIQRLGQGLMNEAEADGAGWNNLEDRELVGLVDRNATPAAAVAELQRRQVRAVWNLAELQEREIDATEALTIVQRDLLETIKTYNQQTSAQTNRLEWLSWSMLVLAIAQVIAAVLPLIGWFE